MKQTTNRTIKQTSAKKPARKTVSASARIKTPYSNLSCDLKDSLLIVSVTANLFILTAWVALQVTTQFDSQVSSLLFTR